MSSKLSFELSNYVIQFKSVIVVPEIAEAFYKFLKQEYATDNWDFILQINKLEDYSKKKNQTKLIKHAKQICSTYIDKDSPKEIAIGKTQKKKILENIAKLDDKVWNLETSPVDLFDYLKSSVLLEYKNDTFKRFSREAECIALLEKYKKNRNVLLPQLSMVFCYKDEDFESKAFEVKDKEFMHRFIEDNPIWELIHTNKKTKSSSFKSPWNYFPKVSFLTDTYFNIKTQMFFDNSFQEVICAFYSNYTQGDPTVIHGKALEFKPKQHVIIEQSSQIGMLTEAIR